MKNTHQVVIADKMDSGAETILRQMGITVDSRVARGEIALEDTIATADALLVRSATQATAALIQKAPNLRVIGRAGIGVDNIDINAASASGIAVMNTPLANAISTAEHAIALIFSIARRIPQANASTQAGKWEKSRFIGTEITGKTLGIIGCGNIGKIVANRALGLHMRVLAFDPALTTDNANKLGIDKASFDQLIETADFITLHTPLIAQTKEILNADTFLKMKPSAYIINAARGGLVNEADLHTALDQGQIAGAALDVYADEPPKNHPLFNHPRVVMTPHIAASTQEAQANVALQIAEQVGNYLLKGQAQHVLNPVVLAS